jgi:hypothetical protein
LKEIGDYDFCGSGIKTIRIPSSVENIGESCFRVCKFLSEVTLRSSPSIGERAFEGCPLRNVNVAKGVILKYDFPKDCEIKESETE